MNSALLGRVAQVALVVDRAAIAAEALDHAELAQQRAHRRAPSGPGSGR